MAEVKIIDNFLEKKQFEFIHVSMMSAWFAWFYNDHITFDDEGERKSKKNHFQFTHGFYTRYEKSNQYGIIEPIVDKLNCVGLTRVKANLGTRTEEHVEHGYHVDFENPSITTGIFYVNTNNGYTQFKNGQKVESVANRFIEFNSQELHQGVSQTDTKSRVAINFNYIKNK